MKHTELSMPKSISLRSISTGLLFLYIVFSFIAQEGLLPPVFHSAIMFAFVGFTVFTLFCANKVMISKFTLWQFVVLAFSALSLLWADKADAYALYTMFVAMIITFCVISTVNTYDRLDLCVNAFIIGCNLMGLVILTTGQIDALEEGERLGEEISGNANVFSALLMGGCLFSVWKMIFTKKKTVKLLCLASTVFQLILMAYSGGRKTILAVVICLVWFILAKAFGNTRKVLRSIVIVIAVIVGIYMALMKNPVLYELVGVRFEGLFDFIAGNKSNVSSDELRGILIKIGLAKWQESPFWGYGIDSFKYYNQMVTGFCFYAHNNYVEILYDLGLTGFALYYGFFGYMAKKIFNTWKQNTAYKALGSGLLLAVLVHDIGGVSFYSTFPLILLSFAYLTFKVEKIQQNQ